MTELVIVMQVGMATVLELPPMESKNATPTKWSCFGMTWCCMGCIGHAGEKATRIDVDRKG